MNSPHDLSPTGPYTKTLGPGGSCSACHIPHGAQDNVLWPRTLYDYRSKLYQRDGQLPTSEQNYLPGTTVTCYDCHDYHGGGSIETTSVPRLQDFDPSSQGHKPQDTLFGFRKNSTGNMTEYNAGPQTGKTAPGYYETDPPGSSGNYGVNLSASPDQTGGHYYKQDPTLVNDDAWDSGDKLSCGVCHDPHAWNADGRWQAFFRKNWPTSAVPSQLGSAGAIGSTYMANAATKYSAGTWSDASRSDSESRLLCIACHGNSDTVESVFFSDIGASFRNDRRIVRATSTVPEHGNTQQVACTSCHVHNSIAASCTGCHGYPPSDTAPVKYPAAPRSPFTFVPSPDPDADASPLTADSHSRHGGNKSGQAPNSFSVYSFGCGVCHYGSAGGVDPSLNDHLNGFVSVVLVGGYGRSPNGPGGAYDNQNYYNPRLGYPPARTGQLDNTAGANGWGGAASPTAGWDNCTNVYCHSAGRTPASMGDNDYRRPQWNTGPIGCNGCHGAGTDNTTIAYGMPDYTNTPATPNTHAPHVVGNRYECTVCHAGTVAGSGAARTILGGSPTLHVNRVREVSFGSGASGTYDNNTRSCSVNCHGGGIPVWGGTLANGCFDCHGGTELAYKPQVDYAIAGGANPVDNGEYLWSGHGRSGSAYTGSGNVPAGFANYRNAPVDCYYCHALAASHTTKSGNDPYRLGSPADNTFGGQGTFTGQWADNTDALCLGCHGNAAQRAGHDNAAKGTATVDAQTHARGITGTKYTWPGPNYPWKCVDCHDPHGDGRSGAERHLMVRSGINAPADGVDGNAGSNAMGTPKRTDANVRSVSFNSLAGYSTVANVFSYANQGNGVNGTWGPCEVCHTQTNAYSRTLDNAATHSSRTGRCTTCHPHNAGFAAKACKGCHGGDTGDPASVSANAPNITRWWQSSGHGMTAPKAIGLECEACHDTSLANPLDHRTDGSAGSGPPPANVNSQFWFGKTETADTGRNVNTAHLGAAYFPTGFPAGNPANKYEYALAFDRKCGNPATGCHRSAVHNQHPVKPPSPQPADNVLTFGQGGTVPNPKAYWWYPAISDYATQFYQSRSPWDINDVTTRAAGTFPDNGVTYGLCVSCHDPHGTNAPVNLLGATTNYMLRGDTRSPNAGQFCNTACHTSRTPP